MSFVHLHNHTQYSLLDGACKIHKMIEMAQEYEMPALAITDHGNMFGAVHFYNMVKKANIKPIIGMEAYIINKDYSDPTNKSDIRHHLILLVMNDIGYHNLMKLSSISYLEGFYHRPRITKRLLEKHNEGLICLSACVKGEVPYHLIHGNHELARNAALWYKSIFGDRYYIEIMKHDLPEEKIAMPLLIALAKEINVQIVLTNDCHYLQKNDSEAHDILLCIKQGKLITDSDRMHYESNQMYFRNPEEMALLYPDIPEAYQNTLSIAERIEFEMRYDKFLLPSIETPPEYKDMGEYLKALCLEGVKTKYPVYTEKIKERLEYELEVVHNMGFDGYFLVVKDIIDNARKQGVPVGPGRGSAAGSIIAYLLDITAIDPLKYNLLFERFLNPERISMPDIDIDFCAQGRSKVIDYIIQKYGRNSVTQIITFSTLGPKSVIKDVARVLGISAAEANGMTKAISGNPKTLDEALIENKEFYQLMNSNDLYASVLQHSKVLEGLIRQTGIHAAGVVIVPGDLTDYVPLATGQKENDKTVVVQYEGKCLEDLKMLKMDILGLKTLTLINKTIDLIKEARGINIDIKNLPLDDEETYKLLASGQTDGIFQFESEGMTNNLMELKPNRLEDLIAMVALYRPGPMQFISKYINRKHGKEKIHYDHPMLEPILKETYGTTVYQEQVMEIAKELGGLTKGEADTLRKAMSKKNTEMMKKYEGRFKAGATANGLTLAVANKIWKEWEEFADYAFNKSHATCYALVAYQTAWLKAHYPVEFMAALLSLEDNPEKIPFFMEACKQMGINVIPPNVNRSNCEFSVHDKEILFGLRAIKNVGDAAMQAIVEDRKKHGIYKNIFEFSRRLDSTAVNKTILESLIAAGAMDELEGSRAQKYAAIEKAIEYASEYQRERRKGQISLFEIFEENDVSSAVLPVLPEVEEWSYIHQLEMEKSVLGFYLSGHPLIPNASLIELLSNVNTENPDNSLSNDVIAIGIVDSITKRKDSKNKPMIFVRMEDLRGKFEVSLFGEDVDRFAHLMQIGKAYLVIGNKSSYNNGEESSLRILPRRIVPFENLSEKLHGTITLSISEQQITDEFLSQILEIKNKPTGKFDLSFFVTTEHYGRLFLQTNNIKLFPSSDFIKWCNEHSIKIDIRVSTDVS